jgi:hypothetical protein
MHERFVSMQPANEGFQELCEPLPVLEARLGGGMPAPAQASA